MSLQHFKNLGYILKNDGFKAMWQYDRAIEKMEHIRIINDINAEKAKGPVKMDLIDRIFPVPDRPNFCKLAYAFSNYFKR